MNQPACNPSADGRSIAGRKATGKTYLECIRMLNGLEKSFERHPLMREHRWAVAEATDEYGEQNPEHRTLFTVYCSLFTSPTRSPTMTNKRMVDIAWEQFEALPVEEKTPYLMAL